VLCRRLPLQNGLDKKVERSRKQIKERKNRTKKLRGSRKYTGGWPAGAAGADAAELVVLLQQQRRRWRLLDGRLQQVLLSWAQPAAAAAAWQAAGMQGEPARGPGSGERLQHPAAQPGGALPPGLGAGASTATGRGSALSTRASPPLPAQVARSKLLAAHFRGCGAAAALLALALALGQVRAGGRLARQLQHGGTA
jgi:hypothetical protein